MFVGDDPRYVPMRIFPGVHYSMGGLWVDFEQRTNIPGLFAAGECDYSIHGANRLGANSLVSCVYGGFVAGAVGDRIREKRRARKHRNKRHSRRRTKRQQEINDQIIKNEGGENQYKLHEEMGKVMTDNVTVVRYNDRLQATDEKMLELIDRFKNISINDSNLWATQAVPHARQFWNMLQLARVITLGALNRNESRGAHYKPDFPERDDEEFLKTTIAEYSEEAPVLSYEAVDIVGRAAKTRLFEKEQSGTSSAAGKRAQAQRPEETMPLDPENKEEFEEAKEQD